LFGTKSLLYTDPVGIAGRLGERPLPQDRLLPGCWSGHPPVDAPNSMARSGMLRLSETSDRSLADMRRHAADAL